jgi:hypothetical protein
MVNRWRMLRPHTLLLVVITLECVVAALRHQSDVAVRQALDNGTPHQRAAALFILTNRDTPPSVDREFLRHLLQSNAALVREWTMTANFTRLAAPLAQEAYIMSLGNSPEGVRCRFFLDYRPVVGTPLTLADLRRFLDASRPGS